MLWQALKAVIKLSLRNLSRRKAYSILIFTSILMMSIGFLSVITLSERIQVQAASSSFLKLLSLGAEVGAPYWCDIVVVSDGDNPTFSYSVLSNVSSVRGVLWSEPFFGTIPKRDSFIGNWTILRANGTTFVPNTQVVPMVEGMVPRLELSRIGATFHLIGGRFLDDGETGVVVVGDVFAQLFQIQVNDTIVISQDVQSVWGTFSVFSDVSLRIVGIFHTGSNYDAKVLTTLEEAQKIYASQDRLTCVFVKVSPDANRTQIYYDINAIKGVGAWIPTEWWNLDVASYQVYYNTLLIPTTSVSVANIQIFMLTVIVTGVFIASVSVTEVYERKGEIGLLRTMGFRPSFIQSMFIFEILIIGVVASTLGFGLFNLLAFLSQSSLASFIPYLTMKLSWGWFLAVFCLSSCVSLLSYFFPVYFSSWITPIELMR